MPKKKRSQRNYTIKLNEFYPVLFCGNDAKLVFEGSMTTGGFKIINDSSEDLYLMKWEDAGIF